MLSLKSKNVPPRSLYLWECMNLSVCEAKLQQVAVSYQILPVWNSRCSCPRMPVLKKHWSRARLPSLNPDSVPQQSWSRVSVWEVESRYYCNMLRAPKWPQWLYPQRSKKLIQNHCYLMDGLCLLASSQLWLGRLKQSHWLAPGTTEGLGS